MKVVQMADDAPPVSIPREEFEELLARAAEKGAKRALSDVGLSGEEAADDVRELRSMLQAFRDARRAAWTTFIRLVVTGMFALLIAGIGVKMWRG